jgi:hypothetical protein
MRNTADLKAGMTPINAMGPKTIAMPIDGGQKFKMNTSAAKQGKDNGGMGPIDIKPVQPKALATKMPVKTPKAPKAPISSGGGPKVGGMIGWGSGGGMGLGRID